MNLLMASVFLIWTSASLAATVSAVKGTKVLISLEEDTAEVGDEFYLINPASGKKTAIIRIKQIKDQKALAEIVKGKAQNGFTLQAKAATPMSADVPSTSSSEQSIEKDTSYLRMLKDSYGLTAGYIMNTMNAEISYKDGFGITRQTSANMSGSGFTVGGFYDYAFNADFSGRAVASFEQFNVTGNSSAAGCSGTTACDAKINYLSLYALGKWYAFQGKYRGWLGGGMGYLFALSKSSTALNEAQISTNQVFTLSLGSDIQLSRKSYIPVSIEYNLFPDSASVKANMIVIKAGLAWNI